MESYDVIFTGHLAEGMSRELVEENLLQLLKCPAERVQPFFQGKALIVKKNLTRERADSYVQAFRHAGALCRIQQSEQAEQPVGGMKSAAKGSGAVRVVTPVLGPVRLLHTPVASPSLSAGEGGITMSRMDRTFIPFDDISLVAVTNDFAKGKPVLRLLLFLRSEKRPVSVDVEKIAFFTFPDVSGDTLLSSLRRFLGFLLEKNPEILVDDETFAVMEGRRPSELKRNLDALATALAALASENDRGGTKPVPRSAPPNRPAERQGTVRQPPSPPIAAPQEEAVVENPSTGAEQPMMAPRPEKRGLKRRAVIFFILSLFFCLGMVSSISKISRSDSSGRMGMTASQMKRMFRGSPELQKQLEYLEYNRKGAKVAANIGMILSAVLAIFFFYKGYRYWGLYKGDE